MLNEFLNGLMLNTALLLSTCIIFTTLYVQCWKRKSIYSFILGIIIGLMGIALLCNTAELKPGVVFDTRSILISISGLFFGFIPTAAGTAVICAYRIFIGGPGVYMGVLVTVSSAAAGLLWKRLHWARIIGQRNKWLEFYLFGLATHIIMLACVLALPFTMAGPVFETVFLPVMLAYPVISMILCMIIYDTLARIRMKEDLEESEVYLRTVIEEAPLGIMIEDGAKTIIINGMFEKITGRSKGELERLNWEEYTHPDDIAEDKRLFARMISGEISGYSLDKRYLKPDGSVVWAHVTLAVLKIRGRNQSQHLCMIQEITDTVLAREDLKRSEASYKALYQEHEAKQALLVCLLNSIPDMIFYKDKNSRYLGCNRAFEKYTGMKEADIVGKSIFELFDRDVAEWYRESDVGAIQGREPQMVEEYVITPDGSMVYFDTIKTPYYDTAGNVLGMVGISRDINERKKKEEEIRYLSYHDALTGLYNRTYFEREKRRLDTSAAFPCR
jgi:PAS domain S-box-containing protein